VTHDLRDTTALPRRRNVHDAWRLLLDDPLWDRVLACTACNSAKSDWLPDRRFVEKLEAVNAVKRAFSPLVMSDAAMCRKAKSGSCTTRPPRYNGRASGAAVRLCSAFARLPRSIMPWDQYATAVRWIGIANAKTPYMYPSGVFSPSAK
jgi:hypothetical protein